jgi:hypothetical protein
VVVLLSGVTAISNDAFRGYAGLKSVTHSAWCRVIEDGTAPGQGAFSLCMSLVTVAIPAGCTRIGASAFKGCFCLAEVTIPHDLHQHRRFRLLRVQGSD